MRLPAHHPTEEGLLGYAMGYLGELKAVLVATHLAYCPACRARVAAYEAQAGLWLEEATAAADPTALERQLQALLGRLDEPSTDIPRRPPELVAPRHPEDRPVPLPLRGWRGMTLGPQDWREVAPGVRRSAWVQRQGETSACLLRVDPGAAVPPHRHKAEEVLLVLKGRFADEHGAYGVGDVATRAAGMADHSVAFPDGECLCLMLEDAEPEFL